MKKLLQTALLMACAFTITACDDSDTLPPHPPTTPTAEGVYVLSEGNFYSKINGALTAYDPATGNTTADIFASANQRGLSGTANDAVVYGSKLYIANTDENIIEVADAKTARSIRQITLSGARCITADGGCVYATSFTGNNVVKIDTTSLETVETIETGANPEDVTIFNGKLYVANSGYGAGNTVSEIDLATFKLKKTLTVPTNPVELLTDGNELFVYCAGAYNDDYSAYMENPAIYRLDDNGTTKIADATLSAIGNGCIYIINDNYYSTTGITYSKYDLDTEQASEWTLENRPFSPCAMKIDPSRGDIYITSYQAKEYNGINYPDYNGSCHVIRFDTNGSQIDKFVAGVNANTIVFF